MGVSLALAITSVAVSAATSIAGGIIGYQQNRAQADNAAAMAEQERLNAQRAQQAANQKSIAIEQEATAKEQIQRQRNKALLAQNRARIGAGGLDYSGTPLLVEIDNAMDMELDIQNDRISTQNRMQEEQYQGHLLAVSHENRARSFDYQKKQYKTAGTTSLVSGFLKAGGEVAGGTAKSYSAYGAGATQGMSGQQTMSEYRSNSFSYGKSDGGWSLGL